MLKFIYFVSSKASGEIHTLINGAYALVPHISKCKYIFRNLYIYTPVPHISTQVPWFFLNTLVPHISMIFPTNMNFCLSLYTGKWRKIQNVWKCFFFLIRYCLIFRWFFPLIWIFFYLCTQARGAKFKRSLVVSMGCASYLYLWELFFNYYFFPFQASVAKFKHLSVVLW